MLPQNAHGCCTTQCIVYKKKLEMLKSKAFSEDSNGGKFRALSISYYTELSGKVDWVGANGEV